MQKSIDVHCHRNSQMCIISEAKHFEAFLYENEVGQMRLLSQECISLQITEYLASPDLILWTINS